ncbi:unnamed protein product [Caenorhabditis nigoni]
MRSRSSTRKLFHPRHLLPAQPSKALGPFYFIPKHLNRRCSVEELPAVQVPDSKAAASGGGASTMTAVGGAPRGASTMTAVDGAPRGASTMTAVGGAPIPPGATQKRPFSSIPKRLNSAPSMSLQPCKLQTQKKMDQQKSPEKSTTGRHVEITGHGLSAVESKSVRGVPKDSEKKSEIWMWMERGA